MNPRYNEQWTFGAQDDIAGTPARSGGVSQYFDSRYTIDANVEYTHLRRFKVFANARTFLTEPQVLECDSETLGRFASGSPHEEFGTQCSVGVKGTFQPNEFTLSPAFQGAGQSTRPFPAIANRVNVG